MERIFKVKTCSNQDPRELYPSERRYSASIVLGFAVIFLLLFVFSTLIGTVIVHKIKLQQELFNISGEINCDRLFNDEASSPSNKNTSVSGRLIEKVENTLSETGSSDLIHYNINIPALICAGCLVMSLGHFVSAATGFLAWKRWYIDRNIMFFFLCTCFSSLTSAISLLLVLLNAYNIENYNTKQNWYCSPVGVHLTIFISTLSFIGMIWSCLASKVAFKGMNNSYPDDVVLSKGGRVEVSTVRKGSKNCSVMPPDILSHFTVGNKLAKYFPKKENSDLPKAESNYEYQQRVNKFLSGSTDNGDNKAT